jgi:hypothetical protein
MNTETLQKQFNIIRIIWLAMLVSLAIYLVICQLAGDAVRQGVGNDIPLDLMRSILIAISVAELLLIDFFRKRTLKPRRGAAPEAVVQKYSVTSLISYAIAESIGIFGMVLYFLGDRVHYLYMLIAISALTMVYYRPKFEELEALVKEAKRGF